VATTVPNFVRGMVVPITMLFQLLRKGLGIQQGALWVGGICMAVALVSLWRLQETFHKDLDYFEEYL
jgi:putative MFS transporter